MSKSSLSKAPGATTLGAGSATVIPKKLRKKRKRKRQKVRLWVMNTKRRVRAASPRKTTAWT